MRPAAAGRDRRIVQPLWADAESTPAQQPEVSRDVGCLRRLGETRVRVPQRDRGGHIDIWFASP
jgi:hypothetical protein